MKRWQDEFSQHPIHATLKILEDNVNTEVTSIDSSGESERARLLKIIGLIKKAVSDLDPDLAPIDVLGALNNQLNSGTMSSVRAFAQQGNPGHLQEANILINAALGYVYQLSALRSGRSPRQSDLDAATSSFERFSKKIESELADLESRATKAINTIEQAAASIVASKNESDTLSTQFQDRILEWNNQNTEFLNNHKLGFSATVSQAKIEFSELLASIRSEANNTIKSIYDSEIETAETNRKEIMSRLEAIEQDADVKHGEILKFYGLVTHDSVTGGHKKIADRELLSATLWRWFTVACIFASLGWIGYSLFCLTPQLEPAKLFWLQIGKTTALTMLLISFAIYASRQSNLHRRNEQKARSFFLKVQAFDPFVASLPDDQRWSMKQAMTERIFGPDEIGNEKTGPESDDFKGMEHIVALMEKVKALVMK